MVIYSLIKKRSCLKYIYLLLLVVFILGMTSTAFAAGLSPLDKWTKKKIDFNCFDITYENNTFIAVGDKGKIITSADGTEWTYHNSGTDGALNGIAYGDGTYAISGIEKIVKKIQGKKYTYTSSVILTSKDNGVSWIKHTVAPENTVNLKEPSAVAFGNNTFVAVGEWGTIFISTDGGDNWIYKKLELDGKSSELSLGELAYANGKFVAVGESGTILTSSDGLTWTKQNSNTSNTLISVIYADNKFVAVGCKGTILTSPDAVVWTKQELNTGKSGGMLTGIAYGSNNFVVTDDSNVNVMTSTDGVNWVSRNTGSFFAETYNDIAYGNNVFCIVGNKLIYRCIFRQDVTLSDVTVDSKIYDGKPVGLKNKIIAKNSLTQEPVSIPDEDFICTYYKKNESCYEKIIGVPKNAGEYKLVVTISEKNKNYSGTSQDVIFSIGKVTATVAGIKGIDREYNGETAVELDISGAQLSGLIEAEKSGISLDESGVTACVDKDAGTDKAVILSGNLILAGPMAANYELEVPMDIKVNITKADLNVKSASVKNKSYDNSTAAEITAVELEGLMSGETLEIAKDYTAYASFLDKKVGNGKEVIGTVVLTDTIKAKNYILNNTNIVTTADIVAAGGLSLVTSPSAINVVAGVEKTYEVNLDKEIKLNKEEPGIITYAPINLKGDSIFTAEPELNGANLRFTITASAISGQFATQIVNVSTSNYGSITVAIRVSVTDKENVTITGINIESKTYDAYPARYIGSPVVEGGKTDKFKISWLDVQKSKTLSEAPVNAGKYKLIISVDSSDEYYMGKSEYEFEIKSKEVKAKPGTVTMVQGDNLPEEFKIIYEGLLGADTIIWNENPAFEIKKADGTVLENSDIEGTYIVKWINASVMTQQNENYNVFPQDGVLIINKKGEGDNSHDKHDDDSTESKKDEKQNDNPKLNDSEEKFTDIENYWAKDAIEYVVSKGLFKGTSENKFEPEKAATRAMIVTVLYRISEMPEHDKYAGNISDINKDAYYYDAVLWAEQLGIISGFEDGTFRPDEKIEREQLAVIIYNYLKKEQENVTADEKSHFADEEEIAIWAQEAIDFCTEQGLLNGRTDGSFDPRGNATRAEIAIILKRLLELIKK